VIVGHSINKCVEVSQINILYNKKIKEIRIYECKPPEPTEEGTRPLRDQGWMWAPGQATPMDKFPEGSRSRYSPGGIIWVKVIAEDGTFGLGRTDSGHVTRTLIRECLAPLVIGQEVGAIELCNDRMWRGTLSFGNEGLTARAVAAVDLALWDLWGKAVEQPVFRLAGGPQRHQVEVYATGNDVDWYCELGFKKFKLARPHGPVDGQAGIEGTVELMARCRELIGPEADLMLDCWMTFDLDYAVRMCEALRPFRMRWMEEMLMPHDWAGHRALRQRVPWQTLADGEHWSTRHTGMRAIEERLVDIIQSDIYWVGGFTEAMKLAHYADSCGIQMCLHTGANDPYGQHWTAAMPNAPLIEFFMGSLPGVPLSECYIGSPSASGQSHYKVPPGTKMPDNGLLGLPDGPGFGIHIPEEWLVEV